MLVNKGSTLRCNDRLITSASSHSPMTFCSPLGASSCCKLVQSSATLGQSLVLRRMLILSLALTMLFHSQSIGNGSPIKQWNNLTTTICTTISSATTNTSDNSRATECSRFRGPAIASRGFAGLGVHLIRVLLPTSRHPHCLGVCFFGFTHFRKKKKTYCSERIRLAPRGIQSHRNAGVT